jgi:hypothetical protein
LLRKIQELEEKLLETQLQLERVTDVAPPPDTPTSKTVFVKPAVPDLPPLLKIKGRTRLMMMFQALRSLFPSEVLLYATTAV